MKVWPASEKLRAVLAHPVGGRFPESGFTDWPDDTYTFRRIRDGDITAVDPALPAQSPPPPPPPEPKREREEREKREKEEKSVGPVDPSEKGGGKSVNKEKHNAH